MRALTIVDCLWIEPHEFRDLIDATPKLVQMVLKRVVKKLHKTNAIAYGAEKHRQKPLKL